MKQSFVNKVQKKYDFKPFMKFFYQNCNNKKENKHKCQGFNSSAFSFIQIKALHQKKPMNNSLLVLFSV
jgi:hypothetical protein